MKTIKKILLLWYREGDNFGDVLISQTVSEYLKKEGFEIENHEVGDNGAKIFEHANRCDFLLFAGGGIIERYVPEVVRKFSFNYENLKVPYGVIGLGVGDFDYSEHRESISFWVNNAAFFFVRDEMSKDTLNMLSESQKVKYSADCVFGNQKIREMLKRNGHGCGVNIRELPYKDITGDFDWQQINDVLKEIGSNVIIPDSSTEMFERFDRMESIEFFQKLSPLEKVEETIGKITECKWMVAMRFHVVLVGAMLGIVSIPVLYCPKVRYLAEQLGIRGLAIEIDEWNKVPEHVKELLKNMDYYKKSINSRVYELEQRADAMFEYVCQYLKKE